MMNKAELEAFARQAAKTIKTETDLNAFSQMLTKITVEAALNAELDEYLGYKQQAAHHACREVHFIDFIKQTFDENF